MVEPTPLKNISQNGNLPQIGVKINEYLKPPPKRNVFWNPNAAACYCYPRHPSTETEVRYDWSLHQATIATPHEFWRNKRLCLFGFYEMFCPNSSTYWLLDFPQLNCFILDTSLVCCRKNMVQRMKEDERPMKCNSGHAMDDPLEKSLYSIHIQKGSKKGFIRPAF